MKKWSESRTIRFNAFMPVLAAIIAAVELVFPMLKSTMGDDAYIYVMFTLALSTSMINIYLRFITHETIEPVTE